MPKKLGFSLFRTVFELILLPRYAVYTTSFLIQRLHVVVRRLELVYSSAMKIPFGHQLPRSFCFIYSHTSFYLLRFPGAVERSILWLDNAAA